VIFNKKQRRAEEEPVIGYAEEVEDIYLTADDATVLGTSFTPEGELRAPDLATALDPHPETPDLDEGYVAYAEVRPHLEHLNRLIEERAKLIEICLYARDRVNSPAAAERIDTSLAGLGITMLRPDGEAFDPALHEASATVPTEDPALHGLIAETELAGYADRGVPVRPPVVSVYRRESP
jgi:molecular chaperone GrpE